MLNMNISNLSRPEIAAAVMQRCSQFGCVDDVTILLPPDRPQIAFALVGMQSTDEMDCIVNKLGGAKMSSFVVITIAEGEANASKSASNQKAARRWPSWLNS